MSGEGAAEVALGRSALTTGDEELEVSGDAVTAGRNTVAPQEPLPHVRLEVVNGRVRAVDDDA